MALVYNQSLPFAFSADPFTGINETDLSGTEFADFDMVQTGQSEKMTKEGKTVTAEPFFISIPLAVGRSYDCGRGGNRGGGHFQKKEAVNFRMILQRSCAMCRAFLRGEAIWHHQSKKIIETLSESDTGRWRTMESRPDR